MSIEDNVALMRNLYEAYGRKNPGPLFESLSEAVRLHFVAPPEHFTFAGSHLGKDGVQRALELIEQEYDWLVYQARDFIAEGDRVVALTDGVLQHRASGKELPMRMVDIIRIEDGRIVEFTEFFDSAALLANDMAYRARRAEASAKARLRAKLPKKAAKKAKPKSRKPASRKAATKTAGARKSKAIKPKAKKKPARRR